MCFAGLPGYKLPLLLKLWLNLGKLVLLEEWNFQRPTYHAYLVGKVPGSLSLLTIAFPALQKEHTQQKNLACYVALLLFKVGLCLSNNGTTFASRSVPGRKEHEKSIQH